MSSLAFDSLPAEAQTKPASAIGAGPFLSVCVQLAAVFALLHAYRIEADLGLLRLTPLVLLGFAVHAWLPLALRMGWFLALSFGAAALLFEPATAAALVATGLALIGVAHLPLPWVLRIAVLVLAGLFLGGLRAGAWEAPWATDLKPALPILGSMFLFRMVLYVHAERSDPRPAPWTQRLAYFFLLPNLLFALFPIVDYRTFQRTYYNSPAAEIYQKGIRWMLRGVFHLLLYRLIYLHFTPAATDVIDLATFVLYMVSAYALYLRVSGLFHLIIGLLCLFGFQLPETHHNYFLASGFNDLWRRINIYWKDFMMKIVYYPVFLRMRRSGATRAMVVSTFVVFLISWWLHSLQLFWVRGTFPLTLVDAIFWILFAVFVLANSLLQARGGSRSLLTKRIRPRAAMVHALKVTSMFTFMCAFWTFWTAGTLPAWLALVDGAASGPRGQFLWLAAGLAALVALGTLWQLGRQWIVERSPGMADRDSFGLPPGLVSVACAGVLALPLLANATPSMQDSLVASVVHPKLNDQDQAAMLRGYYEEALAGDVSGAPSAQVHAAAPGGLGGTRAVGTLAGQRSAKPESWGNLSSTGALVNGTLHPLILASLKPDLSVRFCDTTLKTNRWGMRDKDYALTKPARTHRIALLGASVAMGSGVENDQVFEALVEARLNGTNSGRTYDSYEILNFAVNGLTVIQQTAILEKQVAAFDVDTLMLVAHNVDEGLLPHSVLRLIKNQTQVGYPGLQRILRTIEEGPPDGKTSPEWRSAWKQALVEWSYGSLVAACRDRGILPVYLFVRHPQSPTLRMRRRGAELIEIARSKGFHVIQLDGDRIYPADQIAELRLAPWDHHPNAQAHQRIADEFHRSLLEHEDALGLGLTQPPSFSPATPAPPLDAR